MRTIHLVYFSPGGTTQKTVRNIAKGFTDTKIVEIDMLKQSNREKEWHFGKNDLVILGMMTATKLFGVPNQVINALKGDQTPFVGIVTFGNGYYGSSLKVMQKAMEKRGFKMIAGGAFIGQHSIANSVATNRPDTKDKAIQEQFGKSIHTKIFDHSDTSFHHKIKIDWPNEGFFSTFKCALISAMPGIGFGMPKSWNKLAISDECIKCGKCVKKCPVGALSLNEVITQDQEKCIGCQACSRNCPTQAIKPASIKLIKSVENVVPYRSKRREPKIFI